MALCIVAGALLILVRDVVAVPALRMEERSEEEDMTDVRADPAREGMRGGGGGGGPRRAEMVDDEDGGRGCGLGEGGTGRWGSLGGLGGCFESQLNMSAAAVVGLATEDAEMSSKDSSRLRTSASLPSRSLENVAIIEPGVPPSVIPPSDERDTE
jgi:hypothetical protein